jgi:hypothetical protein
LLESSGGTLPLSITVLDWAGVMTSCERASDPSRTYGSTSLVSSDHVTRFRLVAKEQSRSIEGGLVQFGI